MLNDAYHVQYKCDNAYYWAMQKPSDRVRNETPEGYSIILFALMRTASLEMPVFASEGKTADAFVAPFPE